MPTKPVKKILFVRIPHAHRLFVAARGKETRGGIGGYITDLIAARMPKKVQKTA
jgi:hypothetical protein